MAGTGRRGEFELIAKHFAPLAADYPLAYGLTDDAAAVRCAAGRDLVVTTDCMVASVHFFPDDPPERIAAKLLRVNLSDLAAMGAEPLGYLLSAAWRRDTAEDWIASFAAGLADDQRRFGISLLGGDTVATEGPLTFTLTALGTVGQGGVLRRAGARAGDAVYVSGWIGDAALGLALRQGRLSVDDPAGRRWLLDRHQLPVPRLELGRRLVGVASAALDVSDGLVGDLGHVCETSGLGAEIVAADVPVSAAAAAVLAGRPELLEHVLTGGDDYELLFTVAPGEEGRLQHLAAAAGIAVTRIGTMRPGRDVIVRGPDGAPVVLGSGGFRHF